ncbi:MAG: PAS domain-containing protein, partial [Blastocatellia bacterium]
MIYRLASIVESSDDGVISASLDGFVTSWNRGAEKVYGYTAEEMIGRSLSVLIPPDQPGEIGQLHGRISNGETIAKYETARIRKDGARIIVSLTLSPVKDGRGNVSSVSGIVRDVTESTRLQEQLRQAQKRRRSADWRAESLMISTTCLPPLMVTLTSHSCALATTTRFVKASSKSEKQAIAPPR